MENEKQAKMLAFALSKEVKEIAYTYCKELDTDFSKFVRRILTNYLQEKGVLGSDGKLLKDWGNPETKKQRRKSRWNGADLERTAIKIKNQDLYIGVVNYCAGNSTDGGNTSAVVGKLITHALYMKGVTTAKGQLTAEWKRRLQKNQAA